VEGKAPHLLEAGFLPGVEFAAVLIVAILAANMFHQGLWQRVFACRDDRVVRAAFLWSGVPVCLMVVATGSLGLVAVGLGAVDNPSVALFSVARHLLPPWGLLALLVLAVALCMSSVDTLLNGLASLATVDVRRLVGAGRGPSLLQVSRTATLLLVVPAIVIAAKGISVLYLYLVADLLCSAAVIPVFAGLYAARLGGGAAIVCTVAGLAVGAVWFPWWFPGPGGNFLASFAAALAVSGAGTLLLSRSGTAFDFTRVRRVVGPVVE
jgi:Na+/proline symporter